MTAAIAMGYQDAMNAVRKGGKTASPKKRLPKLKVGVKLGIGIRGKGSRGVRKALNRNKGAKPRKR